MTHKYSNTANQTTLSAGVNSSATSIQVASTTGFPAVDFVLALDADGATQEVVLVTAVAGTTLTVTRGYDNTTAVSHDVGAVVRHSHIAKDFKDSRDHEASTTAHGATGAVVGTTNVQSLTNKTLTLGSNTITGTKAQFDTAVTDADLASLAGAETLTNKTVALGSNTVSGTTAQFNTALSDNDFATLAGVETLTNKTLTSPSLSNPTVTGVGERRYVHKASDESVTSSTVLQDDNALSPSVAASATYDVILTLIFDGASGGDGGLKVGFSMPAGATLTWAIDTNTVYFEDTGAATETEPTAGVGSYKELVVRGVLVVGGTAGSLTLRWAQGVSSATATRVLRRSRLVIERIA